METFNSKLSADGRIVIPAALRKALDVKAGDDLILRVDNGELHAYTRKQALKRAQELMQKHVPPHRNLVDELIAERRKEALRETGE